MPVSRPKQGSSEPASPKPKAKPVFSRKIGAEESDEGYLLVEKAWLKALPPVGDLFELVVGGSTRKVTVAAVPCDPPCRQPPHDHYRISLPLMDLPVGATATMRVVAATKVTLEIATEG